MEEKEFLFSELITEDLLIAHGLSVRVSDPDDRIIDEYDSSDSQPDNTKMYPESQETFSRRRALQKEVELKNKAAREAAVENNTAQARPEADEKVVQAAKHAEEMAAQGENNTE